MELPALDWEREPGPGTPGPGLPRDPEAALAAARHLAERGRQAAGKAAAGLHRGVDSLLDRAGSKADAASTPAASSTRRAGHGPRSSRPAAPNRTTPPPTGSRKPPAPPSNRRQSPTSRRSTPTWTGSPRGSARPWNAAPPAPLPTPPSPPGSAPPPPPGSCCRSSRGDRSPSSSSTSSSSSSTTTIRSRRRRWGSLTCSPTGLPPRIQVVPHTMGCSRWGRGVSMAATRFMFATGIECSYPTIRNGTHRVDELELCDHYGRWREDFALTQELGIRTLRYGPPYYRIHTRAGAHDWTSPTRSAGRLRDSDWYPVMDLLPLRGPGLGRRLLQNPELAALFAEYAAAFAARFPWSGPTRRSTRSSVAATSPALNGWWNERLRADRGLRDRDQAPLPGHLLGAMAAILAGAAGRALHPERSERVHARHFRLRRR